LMRFNRGKSVPDAESTKLLPKVITFSPLKATLAAVFRMGMPLYDCLR